MEQFFGSIVNKESVWVVEEMNSTKADTMKTHIRHIIIALITLSLASGHSYADDKAIAAIGGFLAGVITGVAIDHHDDVHHYPAGVTISTGRSHHRSYSYTGDRCHDHGRNSCVICVGHGHPRTGHWEVRHVKVWIPGHWEYVRDRCGDHVRVWKSGYYTTRPEKVWVSYTAISHRVPIVIR